MRISATTMTSDNVRPNGRPEGASRWKRHWTAALVGSALVHGLCLWLAVEWADRAMLQEAATEPAFDVVFEAPAAQPSPEQQSQEPPPQAQPPSPTEIQPEATPPQPPAPPAEPQPQPVPAPQPPPSLPPPPVQPEPQSEPVPTPQAPTNQPPPQPEPQPQPIPAPQPPPPPTPPQQSPVAQPPPPEPVQPSLPEPPPPPPAQPRPRPAPRPRTVAPVTNPPAAPAPAQAPSSAPSGPAPQPAAAPPSAAWRQALAAWLLAHKTYPEPARQRGIQGTVGLRFTLNRDGHVIGLAVSHSSGSDLLDNAAEAMLRNATLPAPDPGQDRITVSVQLHYTLTDR